MHRGRLSKCIFSCSVALLSGLSLVQGCAKLPAQEAQRDQTQAKPLASPSSAPNAVNREEAREQLLWLLDRYEAARDMRSAVLKRIAKSSGQPEPVMSDRDYAELLNEVGVLISLR